MGPESGPYVMLIVGNAAPERAPVQLGVVGDDLVELRDGQIAIDALVRLGQ
jgi:hypothetical protein